MQTPACSAGSAHRHASIQNHCGRWVSDRAGAETALELGLILLASRRDSLIIRLLVLTPLSTGVKGLPTEGTQREVGQSCPTLEAPWTVAYQGAPPSMGFPRQEYLRGCHFPQVLPDPGTAWVPHCRRMLYCLTGKVDSNVISHTHTLTGAHSPTGGEARPYRDRGRISAPSRRSVAASHFVPRELQHAGPCPSPTPRVQPNPCPLSR